MLDYYTKHSNEHRFGVCTRFLADQPVCQQAAAPMEQQLEGFLPCHVWASDFKLPVDPSTPILMVAGGTGIAPFKAFMEERIFLKTANPDLQLGPAVLFYGVRNPSELGYDALLQKVGVERKREKEKKKLVVYFLISLSCCYGLVDISGKKQ